MQIITIRANWLREVRTLPTYYVNVLNNLSSPICKVIFHSFCFNIVIRERSGKAKGKIRVQVADRNRF